MPWGRARLGPEEEDNQPQPSSAATSPQRWHSCRSWRPLSELESYCCCLGISWQKRRSPSSVNRQAGHLLGLHVLLQQDATCHSACHAETICSPLQSRSASDPEPRLKSNFEDLLSSATFKIFLNFPINYCKDPTITLENFQALQLCCCDLHSQKLGLEKDHFATSKYRITSSTFYLVTPQVCPSIQIENYFPKWIPPSRRSGVRWTTQSHNQVTARDSHTQVWCQKEGLIPPLYECQM